MHFPPEPITKAGAENVRTHPSTLNSSGAKKWGQHWLNSETKTALFALPAPYHSLTIYSISYSYIYYNYYIIMSPTWLPKSQVLHRATEGCLEVQMPSPQPRSRRWRGAPRALRGRRRGRRRRASPAAALGQRTWRTWLAPSPRRAGGRLGQWLSAPSKNTVKSFTEKKFWSSVNFLINVHFIKLYHSILQIASFTFIKALCCFILFALCAAGICPFKLSGHLLTQMPRSLRSQSIQLSGTPGKKCPK